MPIAPAAEKSGSFLNWEGRRRRFEAALRETGALADVRVLDARRVKGLEFDDLIVVAPERILAASALGAHDLYVALTRATRSLCVVTTQPDLQVLAGLPRA